MKPGALLDFLMPSRCAICESPGGNICEKCQHIFLPAPKRFERESLTGLSALSYGESVSKLLIGYKEKGQASLAPFIAKTMLPLTRLEQVENVFLVPVPSRRQNFLRRGFEPSLRICQELAKLTKLNVLNCLEFTREVKDQVGLDLDGRASNIEGSMRVNQPVARKLCLLVDDVVTSGASLNEARRVLTQSGALVSLAITLREREGAF